MNVCPNPSGYLALLRRIGSVTAQNLGFLTSVFRQCRGIERLASIIYLLKYSLSKLQIRLLHFPQEFSEIKIFRGVIFFCLSITPFTKPVSRNSSSVSYFYAAVSFENDNRGAMQKSTCSLQLSTFQHLISIT